VAITLRFPGDRLAHFHVSYATATVNRYSIIGTEGEFHVEPCFVFGPGVAISYTSTINKKTENHKGQVVDHFGGQTDYFSKCIIDGTDPEPDGEEGLRDVRVILAVKRALETGQPQKLAPLESRRHMTEDQKRNFSLASPPKNEINAKPPIKP